MIDNIVAVDEKIYFPTRETAYEHITQSEWEKEEWKEHPEHQNIKVSSLGRVFCKFKREALKVTVTKYRYIMVSFRNNERKRVSKPVHRLVFEAFTCHKLEKDMTIDHLNKIRHDNRLINLECIPSFQNIIRAKVQVFQDAYEYMVELRERGLSYKEISAEVKCSEPHVKEFLRSKPYIEFKDINDYVDDRHNGWKRVSEEDVLKIVRLRESGLTYREIGTTIPCSQNTAKKLYYEYKEID